MAIAIPADYLYGLNLSKSQVVNTANDATKKYQPLVIMNINPEDLMPKVEV